MERREQLAATFVAMAIVVSVAAVGGALPWGVRLFAPCALLCSLPLIRSRRQFESVPLLLLFVGALFLATILQLIPLPVAVVEFLSPATVAIVRDAAQLSGDSVHWLPLSLDPPGTILEATKFGAYAAIAFVCLRVSARRLGRRWLLAVVALVGVALCLTGLIHRALGATLLFGIYEPLTFSPKYLTPFINPNHLAGYFALSTCLCVGLAFAASEPRSRILWAFSGCLTGGMCLLMSSRGGAIAMIVGVGTTMTLIALQRRKLFEQTGTSILRPLMGTALIAVAVIALSASGVATEFTRTDSSEFSDPESKFGAWRTALDVIADYPITGVGRGAFEPTFIEYHQQSSERIYSQLENEYLQAVVDWGIPIGGCLFLLGLAMLTLSFRRWTRSPAASGAAGAVVAIGLQNCADFSLQLPGIATSVIAVLSTLTYVPLATTVSKRIVPLMRCGALLLLATPLLLSFTSAGTTLLEDRQRVRESAPPFNPDEAVKSASAALQRHPADYFLPAAVARDLFRFGDARAVRFANHAMHRHPTHPGTHQLTARLLFGAGQPEQALVEYGLALKYTTTPREVAAEIAELYKDAPLVAKRLRLERDTATAVLETFVTLRRHDLVLALTDKAIEEGISNPSVLLAAAESAKALGNLTKAETFARAAAELNPTAECGRFLADVLESGGKSAEATAVLTSFMERTVGAPQTQLILDLAELHLKHNDAPKAQQVLNIVSSRTVGSETERRVRRLSARIQRSLGNKHQAEWEERASAPPKSP